MRPILTENEYVFGTLKTYAFEKLALLNPISTFQEKEGLTVVVQKEKADEYKIPYSGVFRCITLNVHSWLVHWIWKVSLCLQMPYLRPSCADKN
jgi:hypothetical protein